MVMPDQFAAVVKIRKHSPEGFMLKRCSEKFRKI